MNDNKFKKSHKLEEALWQKKKKKWEGKGFILVGVQVKWFKHKWRNFYPFTLNMEISSDIFLLIKSH